LPKAFAFQQAIGRGRVRERTRALAAQLKQGLAAMPAIRLETPLADGLSAGIVSFNIDGMSADVAVRSLRERRIVASVAPYAAARIRLTPSIVNTPEEVDLVLAEVAAIAA
jgi:selenocysteine lyase/cysteine desulfurase